MRGQIKHDLSTPDLYDRYHLWGCTLCVYDEYDLFANDILVLHCSSKINWHLIKMSCE
jgi:hypothetical protein